MGCFVSLTLINPLFCGTHQPKSTAIFLSLRLDFQWRSSEVPSVLFMVLGTTLWTMDYFFSLEVPNLKRKRGSGRTKYFFSVEVNSSLISLFLLFNLHFLSQINEFCFFNTPISEFFPVLRFLPKLRASQLRWLGRFSPIFDSLSWIGVSRLSHAESPPFL